MPTKMNKLYQKVIDYFSRTMPDAQTELHYENPYQLLVAVILSAQCTDKRVNMVTPALFARYATPQALAAADEKDVFELIRSVSYPNSKSRHLLGMARVLGERFDGQVRDDMDKLRQLPGVGRKTANVIEAVVFDRPNIAVDTHVFRVAARLGLTTDSTTPLETERQLTANIPADIRATAHHWLILHGRYTCTARKPHCDRCGLTDCCLHYRKELSGLIG